MKQINHGKFTIGFLLLCFILPFTISCNSEVSRSVKNRNGVITLSGNDNGDKYECTGTDPEYDSNNTGIYSCNGDELVVDR